MNFPAQKISAEFNSSAFDLTSHNLLFQSAEESAQTKNEKYVVFCLGADFFAVSSENVSEVVQMSAITPLPNLPEWLLGIADLRGTIISVVSLPKLLGLPNATISSKTKFIVLKSSNFPSPVAFAVDRLSEIVTLSSEEIQFGRDEKMPFLSGRTMYKNAALGLLNTENLFSSLTLR